MLAAAKAIKTPDLRNLSDIGGSFGVSGRIHDDKESNQFSVFLETPLETIRTKKGLAPYANRSY
jgi:hypothetical protein